jgi:hypothetical protein
MIAFDVGNPGWGRLAPIGLWLEELCRDIEKGW